MSENGIPHQTAPNFLTTLFRGSSAFKAPTGKTVLSFLRRVLTAVAWFLLVVSGYFLSYQLFFIEMPLEKVATKVSGDIERKDFRYDQVVYFRGYALKPGQKLALDVGTPWITELGKPSIEFFLEAEDLKKEAGRDVSGRIKVTGLNDEPYVYTLKPERLQRFTVPWTNKLGERNSSIEIQYLTGEDLSANATAPPIVLATNIVGFSVWPYIFFFALTGIALLLFAPAAHQDHFSWDWQRNRWRFVLVGIAVLLFFLHSGAFSSDVLFEDHGKVGATCKNLWKLLKTGHWRPTFYRDTGIVIVPAFTALIEMIPALPALIKGEIHRVSLSFCDVYPTAGYLMNAFWIAGLLFLVSTLRALWSFRLALVFAAVSALYFPFIMDLYRPDSDAYFIILFAFYLGLVLRLLFGLGSFRINAAFIILLTFLMALTKVTPIFLTVLLPVTLLLKNWNAGRRRALLHCVVSVAVLFTTFQMGKIVSNQFQHPQRHVGIKGEPFQRNVLWHMLWAAYGKYDRDTAHDFVKLGRVRNERVSERTGLPITTYLRQSETATQQVYKPDVLKALSERPGFFLSTAMHRFYKHGLRFYRYNRLTRKPFGEVLKGQNRKAETISGKRRTGVEPAVSLIRYGEAWKIAPLIFIGKLTQSDMTRLADTLLLAAAIIGIFGFKSVPLRFFLIIVALAQIGFSFAFHDVDRYFMFCSWALLLGLSVFLYNAVAAINREKI